MTFDDFLEIVGDPNGSNRSDFSAFWEGMMRDFPPAKYASEFLTDDAVRSNLNLSPQHPSSLIPLLEMAHQVREDPVLLALAALIHRALFTAPEKRGVWHIPFPPSLSSPTERGLFNFLLALGFLSLLNKQNRERNIPEQIITDTLRQVDCYNLNFRKAHGENGIFTHQLCWLHKYMAPARFFRIGRLEFCQETFRHPFRLYQHKKTKELITLCEGGIKFLPGGGLCATDAPPPTEARETTFTDDGNVIIAHQVGVRAQISTAPVSLSASEWELLVSSGAPVLEMHIPSGGKMTPDLIKDSLERSVAFFDNQFPDTKIRAITCDSWLFSSQLEEILPQESHILNLQSHFQLLPRPPNKGSDDLWFLFLERPPYDIDKLPADTSMRRAMIQWLKKGGRFCCGAAIRPILREE